MPWYQSADSRCLLGSQDLHKPGMEIIEVVGLVDVTVQGMGIELGQDIDAVDTGIDAVADGDVDQPVFSSDGHGRFRAELRQWKKA